MLETLGMVLVLCFTVILLFKNFNTYKNMIKVLNAILEFNLEHIDSGESELIIDYDNMVSYDKHLYNLLDWGVENIMKNKEDWEKIKPFMR